VGNEASFDLFSRPRAKRAALTARDGDHEMGMTIFKIFKSVRRLALGLSAAMLLLSASLVGMRAEARELVSWQGDHAMGTIVVKTSERNLYYVLGHGMALRYDVAVGKEGMEWSGETFVQSKRRNPGWTPTPRMRRENPRLPAHVRAGPDNPLGIRAIYLGWTEYRIHGTNAPGSIGRASSSGCIRMRNSDVADLYERVHIGAPVHVIH
jgi:lipoprotein-anchoring transpeptidase ErfK/SrfK